MNPEQLHFLNDFPGNTMKGEICCGSVTATVCPWEAGCLSLHFPTCKLGMSLVPTSLGCSEDQISQFL